MNECNGKSDTFTAAEHQKQQRQRIREEKTEWQKIRRRNENVEEKYVKERKIQDQVTWRESLWDDARKTSSRFQKDKRVTDTIKVK